MTVSKIRLPDNTEHDIRAKYLIQSTSADAVSAEFSARTVTEDAIANIQKIYGNTVKFNQLIKNGNFADSTTNWSARPNISIAVSNNVLTVTVTTAGSGGDNYGIDQNVPAIASHKYFIRTDFSTSLGRNANVEWIGVFGNTTLYSSGIIVTANNTANATMRFKVGGAKSVGDTWSWANIQVFDLTQMYGSGNEPTITEFEEQYPAAYYPYDSGSLTSNSATAILSRGFNQWDEEWTRGNINNDTGVVTIDTASGTMLLSKNRIHVLPNTTYCLHYGKTGSYARVHYYTSLTGSYINKTGWIDDDATFTTPPDCTAVLFKVSVSVYGSVYNNDICFNISDLAKNGTYEPYNGHQIDLNIPTLTGKLNGAGSSVVIFPDGLKKVGTVCDEIVGNKAIKRVGSVDLGTLTLTWSMVSDASYPNRFQTVISGIAVTGNNLIPGYTNKGLGGYGSAINEDKSFDQASTTINVHDSSYSTAASFKTAMSGVLLYYELATPEEYILDNALQLQYPVVAGGTEMVLPTTGTAPMKMDVIYGNAADAAATMSQNFISVDSMKEFLAELGTQMNGTWAMQYSGGKYTFTFTSN